MLERGLTLNNKVVFSLTPYLQCQEAILKTFKTKERKSKCNKYKLLLKN